MNYIIDNTLQNIVFNGNDVQRIVYNGIEVWSKGGEPHDYSTDYFTLEALENGKFTFNIICADSSYLNELKRTIYYSKNGGSWTSLTFSVDNSNYIDVVNGDKIILKGTNAKYGVTNVNTYNNHDVIRSTGSFKVYGNIMSLINGDNFVETSLTNDNRYTFVGLFEGKNNNEYCNKLVDVSNIYLPSAVQGSYYLLFNNCYYLTNGPKCSISISSLSGLSRGREFASMFGGCTNLTTAPEFIVPYVYNQTFSQTFTNCTSLVNIQNIVLPATTLNTACYYGMFEGCTSLTTAPILPATTLKSNCYYHMFYGCTSLRYIKALFTTTPSSSYTGSWVSGCSNTSDFIFVKNSAATWTTTGDNAVLSNWTIQYEAA